MVVEQLQKFYHYLFVEIADDRVKDWPLMGDPWKGIGLIALYLVLIYRILPYYMSSRKAYTLRTVLAIYNLSQVLMCIAIIYRMIKTGLSLRDIGCNPPEYDYDNISKAENFWWLLLIKLVEFSETCFFVLRKKFEQASPLHVYHHASTFVLVWLGCKYGAGGMLLFPLMLNTVVHVVMYAYYFLSCLGPEVQKIIQPYKSRITQIQLIQLVIIFLHASQVFIPGCKVPWAMPIISMPNQLINIWNFSNFYIKTYIKKKVQ